MTPAFVTIKLETKNEENDKKQYTLSLNNVEPGNLKFFNQSKNKDLNLNQN